MELEERREKMYKIFATTLEVFIDEVLSDFIKRGLINENEDTSEEKINLLVSSIYITLMTKAALMAGNLSMGKADIVALFVKIINALYKNIDLELVRNKINVRPVKNQEHIADVINLEEFRKKREK